MEAQCCVRIYGTNHTFRGSPCSKPVKVVVNGRNYCSIHDPAYVAKKDAERKARWDAENKRERAKYAISAAAPRLLEVLTDALKTAEVEKHPFRPWHNDAKEIIEKIKAAQP